MKIAVSIVIAIALLISQQILSGRKQWYLGAILPVLYAGFAVWLKLYKIPTMSIWPLLVIEAVLLVSWVEGRQSYKKKALSESEKSETKDI